MKYRITSYQPVYNNGSRDKVKLAVPIYTDDIESERGKLKVKHSGLGKACIGVNLEYEQLI